MSFKQISNLVQINNVNSPDISKHLTFYANNYLYFSPVVITLDYNASMCFYKFYIMNTQQGTIGENDNSLIVPAATSTITLKY